MKKALYKKINKTQLTEDILKFTYLTDLANHYGCSRTTLYTLMRKYGVTRTSCKLNEFAFAAINSYDSAYWLGFLMADGCMSRTQSDKVVLKLAGKDKEHLFKFREFLRSNNKIVDICDGSASVSFYSTILCDDLEKHGCTTQKSLTLQYPNIDAKYDYAFIRGYFDGDGSVGVKKDKAKSLRITFLGTHDFLNVVKTKLQATSSVLKRQNIYYLEISGNRKVPKIYSKLYKDGSYFLNRKKEIFDAQL